MATFSNHPTIPEIFSAYARNERTVVFVPTVNDSTTDWECRSIQWGTIFGDNAYTLVEISMPSNASKDEIYQAFYNEKTAQHMALCKAA